MGCKQSALSHKSCSPSTFSYEGVEYPVTQIQFTQWDKRRNVTALTLPDTLTAVNHSSFYKFPALKEITIPGSIKNFDGSFQNMSDLLTITFDEGVEEISSNSMVYGCDVLAEINLPTSLKRITAPAAFASAPALKSIHLPEGLVIAEGSLLSDCTALTHVELPASITEIPSNTFSGCSKLERVSSPGADHCDRVVCVLSVQRSEGNPGPWRSETDRIQCI